MNRQITKRKDRDPVEEEMVSKDQILLSKNTLKKVQDTVESK